jgi:hypothetical protein
MIVPILVKAGGAEDFIGFIFFVIVISVVNRLKKAAEQRTGEQKQRKGGQYAAPRQELQNFLKGLQEQTTGTPAVVPPPAPARRALAPSDPPQVSRQPVPAAVAPTQRRAPESVPQRSTVQGRRRAACANAVAWLKHDGDSLRRAIIAREVLGPPVALSETQGR